MSTSPYVRDGCGKVVAAVFDRYPVGGGERLLALALAYGASDDGTLTARTSVPDLARQTRQTERGVQKQLRRMEASGWLQVVKASTGGRGLSTVYRISSEWINGTSVAFVGCGAQQ